MSRRSVLGRGRRRATRKMIDTCRITVPDPNGEKTWNPTTGRYDEPTLTVYEGRCSLKAPDQVNPYQQTAGPEAWSVEDSVLELPAAAAAIGAGATVHYLRAPENSDLEGRVFGVVGPHHETDATAQRVLVKEIVTAGGGS